jgi:hypothetical protein
MKLNYHFVTVNNLNHDYLLSEYSQIAQQARRAQRILRGMQEQDRQNTANLAVVIRADGEQRDNPGEAQAVTGEEEEEDDPEEDQFSAEDRNWYANYISAAAAVRPAHAFFGLDPRPLSPLRFTSGMMIIKLSCFWKFYLVG